VSLGLTKMLQGPAGEGLPWGDVGLYAVVQVIAGVAASLAYSTLFNKSFSVGPAEGFDILQAGLCEVLYTFMLCFVVLNVAATRDTKPNQYFGLAIGFVIVAGAYGAGAVSGGCFNPAVALGIQASALSFGKGGLATSLVYVVFELVGATLAALLFRAVRPKEFDKRPNSAVTDLLSEFLGTFMLVLTVGLNVLGKSPAGAFSIAASLMCMIYSLGDVSGAHFNPAVTVALFVSGRLGRDLQLGTVLCYFIFQLFGGISAAFTYSFIHGGASFALQPGKGFGLLEVCAAEAVFTFVLCYVVLSVAVSKTTKTSTMFGLAIGACVTVGGNAIGPISGGCLNPAVAFGIAMSHFVAGSLVNALSYTGAEVLGAVAAAAVFHVTHMVDIMPGKKDDAEGP